MTGGKGKFAFDVMPAFWTIPKGGLNYLASISGQGGELRQVHAEINGVRVHGHIKLQALSGILQIQWSYIECDCALTVGLGGAFRLFLGSLAWLIRVGCCWGAGRKQKGYG